MTEILFQAKELYTLMGHLTYFIQGILNKSKKQKSKETSCMLVYLTIILSKTAI